MYIEVIEEHPTVTIPESELQDLCAFLGKIGYSGAARQHSAPAAIRWQNKLRSHLTKD